MTERSDQAVALRSQGKSFQAIADRLGVSRQRAHQLVGPGLRHCAECGGLMPGHEHGLRCSKCVKERPSCSKCTRAALEGKTRCAVCEQSSHEEYARRRARGLCYSCSKRVTGAHRRCDECRERRKLVYHARIAEGRCGVCGQTADATPRRCKACKANETERKRRSNVKRQVASMTKER